MTLKRVFRSVRVGMAITVALVFSMTDCLPASATPTLYSDSSVNARRQALRGEFSLAALDVGENEGVAVASYGYTCPGGLSSAEFSYCVTPGNALSCLRVKEAADDALRQAQEKFPGSASLNSGKGDAFRHCYWSARMTMDLGSEAAQGFGNRYESETREGPEKRMDLVNNATGRSVGRGYGTYAAASARCQELARWGKLYTLH